MQRFLTIFLCLLLTVTLLAGCGQEKKPNAPNAVSDPHDSVETALPNPGSIPDNNVSPDGEGATLLPSEQPANTQEPALTSDGETSETVGDENTSETVDDYVVTLGEDQVVIFD